MLLRDLFHKIHDVHIFEGKWKIEKGKKKEGAKKGNVKYFLPVSDVSFPASRIYFTIGCNSMSERTISHEKVERLE